MSTPFWVRCGLCGRKLKRRYRRKKDLGLVPPHIDVEHGRECFGSSRRICTGGWGEAVPESTRPVVTLTVGMRQKPGRKPR